MEKHALPITLVLLALGCSSSSSDPTGPATTTTAGPKAYIGLFGDQAVAVLDTSTNKVLKTIPVTAPDGLVITPDNKKIYVSSTDSGTVKVISTDTDTVTASITVGAKPAGLTMTPDGKYVIAAVNGANSAEVIDTSTDAVINKVVVPFAHSSCVSPDSRFAYVGSQAPNAPAVVVVDITSTTAAPVSYPVDKSPRALGCAAGNKVYFTAAGVDALEVMDATTGKVGTPITTGGSPHDTRPTNDGKFELIVSQTAGDLEMIDQTSSTVASKIPTGKMPHWIALTSGGAGAYVTNEGDNNVVLVDLDTKSVVTTIPVGNAPRKIAIQH